MASAATVEVVSLVSDGYPQGVAPMGDEQFKTFGVLFSFGEHEYSEVSAIHWTMFYGSR
jgi:hypothetical protein